jgi:hypothetical protein
MNWKELYLLILTKREKDNYRWDSTQQKLETTDTSHWLGENEKLMVNINTGEVRTKCSENK